MISLVAPAAAASNEPKARTIGTLFDYGVVTYLWVIGLAMWGGFAHWLRKVKLGVIRAFNLVELIGELVISGLVGVVTFWLCEGRGMDPYITAALIAISGHMGSRGIFLLEDYFRKKVADL